MKVIRELWAKRAIFEFVVVARGSRDDHKIAAGWAVGARLCARCICVFTPVTNVAGGRK